MRFRSLFAFLAGGLAGALATSPAVAGTTLGAVKQRGFLQCGVAEIGVGLSYISEAGDWAGFFPAYCRAVAAATLGRADAVEFVLVETGNWFEFVRSNTIDVLSSNSTWTLRRDASLGLNWVGVLYYDGQGFLAHRSLGAKNLAEVGAASMCVQSGGTTTVKNLAEYRCRATWTGPAGAHRRQAEMGKVGSNRAAQENRIGRSMYQGRSSSSVRVNILKRHKKPR